MNCSGVLDEVVKLLKNNLAQRFSYHDLAHTLSVAKATEDLANAYRLNEEDIILVKTAALLHDTGFIVSAEDHEEESCSIARRLLPAHGYDNTAIEKICELIMATKFDRKPETLLAKILRDADVSYLGSDRYFETAAKLKKEWLALGKLNDLDKWDEIQLDFLQKHHFCTDVANEWYGPTKEKIIQQLKAQSKQKFVDTSLPEYKISWMDIVQITAGIFLAGLALKGFLVPNHFFDGGLTGISLLIHEFYNINLGLIIFLVNLPFVIVSYFMVGRKFAARTLIAIILLGLCLLMLPTFALTTDKLLISIFGGAFLGIGVGLVMRSGAALDGIEVLALFTLRKSSFKITEIIFAINVIIFTVAAIYFGITTALYSILTYFTATRTIDYVVEGIRAHTGVTIVSGNSEMIKQELVSKLGKAITVYKGQRGFLPGQFEVSEDCDIIFTVISRMEMRRVKNLVYAIDPKAFIFANTIRDASGGVLSWHGNH